MCIALNQYIESKYFSPVNGHYKPEIPAGVSDKMYGKAVLNHKYLKTYVKFDYHYIRFLCRFNHLHDLIAAN